MASDLDKVLDDISQIDFNKQGVTMNLAERMKKESFESDLGTEPEIMKLVKLSDAIRIAEEHATEMCRKQREICAEAYQDKSFENEFHEILMYDIKTAPLASEE